MLGVAWDVYSGITKAKNGGDKKKDKPQEVAVEEEKEYTEVDTAAAFRDVPLIMTDGTERMVTKFEALDYFAKIKRAIGEESYRQILESAGYKKSNLIPEASMPQMYALMIKAYKEIDDALPF